MISKFAQFTDGFFETENQVHDWVMRRAREYFAHDRARRACVTDTASFDLYKRERQEKFLTSIGGLPTQRNELNVIETGRLQRREYSVRKLIYQSLPAVYVTALLYVPENLEKAAPAVLVCCGHHKDGKAAPKYQQVCIDLVRTGFVALIIDSPSQGEMVQCLKPGSSEPLVGVNTIEHSFLQLSASIIGHNIARYFLWNAIRAIDLLCELPEVDSTRIGATGNSGGGTLTQYLMMLDSRVNAAMPCCSLSSREAYLATGVRAYDGEQNLFGSIRDGVDYADFLAAFAPRPLRVGAAEYDFFGIEGVLESVEEARSIYRVLGAEDAIDLCVAKDELHGYSVPLRRGCVDWFARHLLHQEVEPLCDEPEVETSETLQCTQSGQVMRQFSDARSILDLNRETWQQKRATSTPVSRDNISSLIGNVCDTPLRVRRTKRTETEQCTVEHIFFFTEPGIITTAVIYAPVSTPKSAALLLIPGGTEGQEPFCDQITRCVQNGQLVMVFDVRGTGAVKMRKRNAGEGLAFRSTEFRVASDHFLLGDSIAMRRAYDVKRALEYLRSRKDLTSSTPIELMAHGWSAIYGVLAACTKDDLARCTFEGLPKTWGDAFELAPPEPEMISEPLIIPQFAGAVDISDLLRLATERCRTTLQDQ